MKYFMGIDGGNSKTQIVIIDDLKNIIFDLIEGASSI